MSTRLKVLIIEDSEDAALLLVRKLRSADYDVQFERVENFAALDSALEKQSWDLVLSDYSVPGLNTCAALASVREKQQDAPVIIVSGTIGEDTAVEAMRSGAHDYLMKGNLTRFVPAVKRELAQAANRIARREAERLQRESELRYRLLWEACPDAVVLMDSDRQIHFANPAMLNVFGYQPEEVVGQNFSLLQPEAVRRSFPNGRNIADLHALETAGLRKDGTEIVIEVSFSNMVVQGEQRHVGFVRDVTERKRTEQELQKNQQQFAVAREIQQRLFPKTVPTLPGFDIAGVSYPTEATGGDYFDYLPMRDHRLGIIIGDVTGHGLGPALLMAETRAYFRILATSLGDLASIFTHANHILAEDTGMERFITLMLAQIDPKTRSLRYVNAGHPNGYVLARNGDLKAKLNRTSPPLGLFSKIQATQGGEIQLDSGDLVLFLTDGITEAMSPNNEFFGAERALDFVRQRRHLPAGEIVKQLYDATRSFEQNAVQSDDVTLVIVKVL